MKLANNSTNNGAGTRTSFSASSDSGCSRPTRHVRCRKLLRDPLLLVLGIFVYFLSMSQVSFAQGLDPDDTIIVYGGFGYLDSNQQPMLHDLIRRGPDGRSKYVNLGRSLQMAVRADAQIGLSGADFERWTSYPIIYSPTDLFNAHEMRTGENTTNTSEIFDSFERAYLLVFSGGFEHEGRYTQSQENGLVYAYSTVGVSATLVDLKGGNEIVLSATHMGILEVQESAENLKTLEQTEDTVARFARVYRQGASGAIGSLARIARKSNPSLLTSDWDVYAVTGGFIPGDEVSKSAAELFDWNQQPEIGSFCSPANYCDPTSQACKAMLGYLTTTTSQALSIAGIRVLPPMSWERQAQKSSSIALRTLSLPSSGLPDLVQSAAVNYSPEQATVKVVPVLAATTVNNGSSTDGTYSVDAYSAVTTLQAARTRYEDCGQIIEEFGLGEISQATVKDSARPNSSSTNRSGQQLIMLRAIRESVLQTRGVEK